MRETISHQRELLDVLTRIIELESSLEKLKAGRADIVGKIKHAEEAKERASRARDDSAKSIVNAIKAGIGYSIEKATNAGSRLASSRIEASLIDLEVSKRAADCLNKEIAEVEEKLAALRADREDIADRALRECGQVFFKEYESAIDAARRAAIKIRALDKVTGLISPQNMRGFTVDLVDSNSDIFKTVKSLVEARAAMIAEPKADPFARYPQLTN